MAELVSLGHSPDDTVNPVLELKLLAILMQHRQDMIPSINAELFGDDRLKLIFDTIHQSFLQTGAPPDEALLRAKITNLLGNKVDKPLYWELIAKIFRINVQPAQLSEILDALDVLRKKRKLSVCLPDVVNLAQSDPNKAYQLLQQFAQEENIQSNGNYVIDLVENFNLLQSGLHHQEHEGILTGITPLDAHIGKVLPGELVIFIGVTESGKSVTLQDIAAHTATQGHRTLYVTLEMTAKQVAYRLSSRLTGIPYNKFRQGNLDEDELRRWHDCVKNQLAPNRLAIAELLSLGAKRTVADIKPLILRYQPEVLLVDYLTLLSPVYGSREAGPYSWQNVTATTEDLKRLAVTHRLVCFSAWQLRTDSEQKDRVTFADAAYAKTGMAQTTDIAVAIIRTREDKISNRIRMQVLKVRDIGLRGAARMPFEVFPDFDTIRINRGGSPIVDKVDN